MLQWLSTNQKHECYIIENFENSFIFSFGTFIWKILRVVVKECCGVKDEIVTRIEMGNFLLFSTKNGR